MKTIYYSYPDGVRKTFRGVWRKRGDAPMEFLFAYGWDKALYNANELNKVSYSTGRRLIKKFS